MGLTYLPVLAVLVPYTKIGVSFDISCKGGMQDELTSCGVLIELNLGFWVVDLLCLFLTTTIPLSVSSPDVSPVFEVVSFSWRARLSLGCVPTDVPGWKGLFV